MEFNQPPLPPGMSRGVTREFTPAGGGLVHLFRSMSTLNSRIFFVFLGGWVHTFQDFMYEYTWAFIVSKHKLFHNPTRKFYPGHTNYDCIFEWK